MAMKKPTKSDIKAGRVYRCGNCDALCDGSLPCAEQKFVMGRPQHVSREYYCDLACACKHGRDKQRPKYEANLRLLVESEVDLKELLQCYIECKLKSKTIFQAIRVVRQEIKTLRMLLSGESALHIMKVEFFKLSEAAMELAELIGEEEDPIFTKYANEDNVGPVTELAAQNTAMCARSMAEDKYGSLSMWFN